MYYIYYLDHSHGCLPTPPYLLTYVFFFHLMEYPKLSSWLAQILVNESKEEYSFGTGQA